MNEVSQGQVSPVTQVKVGYGVSLNDLGSFEQALSKVQTANGVTLNASPSVAPGQALRAMLQPLEKINTEAEKISVHANEVMQAGKDVAPGEMVRFSVKVHEFMFNCQLTSNAANRASDGIQQLFRQQS